VQDSKRSSRAEIPWREDSGEGIVYTSGWVNLYRKEMQARLEIEGIDGISLHPYYTKWVDLENSRIEQAKLNFFSDVQGMNNEIVAQCRLELTDIEFSYDGNTMYVSVPRSGCIYEITGPFNNPIPSIASDSYENMTSSSSEPSEIMGYVLLDVSLENMNKLLAQDIRYAISITVVLIGIVALISVQVVRRMIYPLQLITDATRSIADGDLEQSVNIDRADEIGDLAHSFNNMINQLNRSREENEALKNGRYRPKKKVGVKKTTQHIDFITTSPSG